MEGLLDERFYLALLQLPLILVHDQACRTIVDALSSDTRLVVTQLLVLDDTSFARLLLIQSGSHVRLIVRFCIILLERYVAEEHEHFIWSDRVILYKVEPIEKYQY